MKRNKVMEQKVKQYANDWKLGKLTNIFALINLEPLLDSTSQEKVIDKIAQSFLAATNSDISIEYSMAEKTLLESFLLYLYLEAPTDEQNMLMLLELCEAGIVSSDYNGRDCFQSDLDGFYKFLEEKDRGHAALKGYKKYKNLVKSSEGNNIVLRSLLHRLSPIFSGERVEIFSIAYDDIIKLAYALISNLVNFQTGKVEKDELRIYVFQIHMLKELPCGKQSLNALNRLNYHSKTIAAKLGISFAETKKICTELRKIYKFYYEFEQERKPIGNVWEEKMVENFSYEENIDEITSFLEDADTFFKRIDEAKLACGIGEIQAKRRLNEKLALPPKNDIEKQLDVGFAKGEKDVSTPKQGMIKWWNDERGYGFITADDGKDVFIRAITLLGNNSLNVGQRVEFQIVHEENGLHGVQVRLI
jgi:CspA family cold shock protein